MSVYASLAASSKHLRLRRKEMTKIMLCSCKHPAQDRFYGAGMRVHNFAPGNRQARNVWRCTVCVREKEEKKPERLHY